MEITGISEIELFGANRVLKHYFGNFRQLLFRKSQHCCPHSDPQDSDQTFFFRDRHRDRDQKYQARRLRHLTEAYH